MKKVINKVLCNTETADKIGEISYRLPGDLDWYEESLFRTKSGKYFIYGEGGPRSKYGQDVAYNQTKGGDKFYLLTREDAAEWAEENLSGDEFIAEFGNPDDDEKQVVHVKISKAARQKLDVIRSQSGENLGEIISRAILAL